MAIRQEIKHSMLRRCRDWDYSSPCIYMITLTLAERHDDALGRLVHNGGKWNVAPTPEGAAVLDALDVMPRLYPQVRILARQLMPDHLHFVVHVRERLPKPMGELVRGLKAGVAARWKALAKSGEVRNDCEASCVPANSCTGLSWSPGFQDTILFHEGQLKAMLDYVADNPRRLATKRDNPQYFRVLHDVVLPLGDFTGSFSVIGNIALLSAPSLLQVQCSRSDFAYKRMPKSGGGSKIAHDAVGVPMMERSSARFEEKCAELLSAAKHGAVLVSPCISDGEREIARLAFDAGAKVVVLKNMGFSPMYKPGGKLFDKTADGRLLMLAPAAWPYQTQAKPMTREDACVLNRLAQLLARDGAVEIDYKGREPKFIDEDARAACLAEIEFYPGGKHHEKVF